MYSDPIPQVLRPKQLPSSTHEVITVLESIHVPWEDVHLGPKTHEVLIYRNTNADEDDVAARIKEASIAIVTTCKMTAGILSQAPYLKLVMCHGVGTDHIDLDYCRQNNIQVMNCTNCNAESVAEHAISLYFATRRSLVTVHNSLTEYDVPGGRPNEWRSKGTMNERMRDSTGAPPRTCVQEVAGIVGFGTVGKHIARLCRSLGMKVLISERKEDAGPLPTPTPTPPPPAAQASSTTNGPQTRTQEPEQRVPFKEVLTASSVIFLSAPLTPSTVNLISHPELALMSPSTVIINVSRGGIVDEAAVLSALSSALSPPPVGSAGSTSSSSSPPPPRIFGYGTDVFATEPAGSDADSVLLGEEVRTRRVNVTLTAHLAWLSETTIRNQVARVKENLRAYVEGDEGWVSIVVRK